jgi:hypothetical protein
MHNLKGATPLHLGYTASVNEHKHTHCKAIWNDMRQTNGHWVGQFHSISIFGVRVKTQRAARFSKQNIFGVRVKTQRAAWFSKQQLDDYFNRPPEHFLL